MMTTLRQANNIKFISNVVVFVVVVVVALLCAVVVVEAYSVPLSAKVRTASLQFNPIARNNLKGNVKNQWPLVVPGRFGLVTIPGQSLKAPRWSSNRGVDNDEGEDNHDWDSSTPFFALPSTFTKTRNPFSIYHENDDDFDTNTNDYTSSGLEGLGGGSIYGFDNFVERNNNNRGSSDRGSSSSRSSFFPSSPFSRFQTPAVSMANYMSQNNNNGGFGGAGGGGAGGTPPFGGSGAGGTSPFGGDS